MPPQLNKTNARSLKATLKHRAVQRVVAFAMNEWQRQVIDDPELHGKLPSYGQECARFLVVLLDQLTAPKRPSPKPSLKTSHRKPAKKRAR